MKLEVVVIPVSDVDRAKRFYLGMGWRLDADFASGDWRILQVTPPGSACSFFFGKGLTKAAPGSAPGLMMIVDDIEATRAELAGYGVEVSEAFQAAHEMGLATILWCYLRNPAFKKDKDYHVSADLSGQANHLGTTIEADIIKQKLPETNGGYNAINFGKTHKKVYSELSSDHPIDLTRYQLANCYMGRAGLINSGGASAGESDLKEAVKTSVINKRAGGMGLISGRKAFQRPMKEGAALLNAIQDVYLDKKITVA